MDGRRQTGFDHGRVDDQAPVVQFQFPWIPQTKVIPVGDRDLHLHGRGAQIQQTPEGAQRIRLDERFMEGGRGQFQIEFAGEFGDRRHEPFGQVFVVEGAGWRRRGWFCAGLFEEQQGGQGGTAGDEDGSQVLVFDRSLLSRGSKRPGLGPGRLSGGLGVSAASLESGRHQTKTRALSQTYSTE